MNTHEKKVGCLFCIQEKRQEGMPTEQAIAESQYPISQVVIKRYGKHKISLCFKHACSPDLLRQVNEA